MLCLQIIFIKISHELPENFGHLFVSFLSFIISISRIIRWPDRNLVFCNFLQLFPPISIVEIFIIDTNIADLCVDYLTLIFFKSLLRIDNCLFLFFYDFLSFLSSSLFSGFEFLDFFLIICLFSTLESLFVFIILLLFFNNTFLDLSHNLSKVTNVCWIDIVDCIIFIEAAPLLEILQKLSKRSFGNHS